MQQKQVHALFVFAVSYSRYLRGPSGKNDSENQLCIIDTWGDEYLKQRMKSVT